MSFKSKEEFQDYVLSGGKFTLIGMVLIDKNIKYFQFCTENMALLEHYKNGSSAKSRRFSSDDWQEAEKYTGRKKVNFTLAYEHMKTGKTAYLKGEEYYLYYGFNKNIINIKTQQPVYLTSELIEGAWEIDV